jgi:AraC-like DNA-binding protein
MTVQQIADKCGFTDAQNFSQAFKRWQGMSPSEFRQSRDGKGN